MKVNYIFAFIFGATVLILVGFFIYKNWQRANASISTGVGDISFEKDKTNGVSPTIFYGKANTNNKVDKASQYPKAIDISTPDGFINADDINIKDQLGKKVVLIEFWTYSCINCQRVLPYLNTWYDKYKDQGLEVIGIHTPEFAFEKKYENVVSAVKRHGVKFPVVLDNDFSTWKSYKNQWWPRKFLIDIDGYVVYDHIGEGGYEETELKIQELLEERKQKLGMDDDINKDLVKVNAEAVTHGKSQSPETYFGALRNSLFANGKTLTLGVQKLSRPSEILPDRLYLTGEWDLTGEYAENVSDGEDTRVIYKYSAEKVFIVARSENEVNVQVVHDGRPVEGVDAGEHMLEGVLPVKNDQLYRIIENKAGHGEHTLELIMTEPGVQLFAFTFG